MSNLEIWTPLLATDWVDLSETTSDSSQAEHAKNLRAGAAKHLGFLSQGLHLTTLAGCGASIPGDGVYGGPSMKDLMDEVRSAKKYAEVVHILGNEATAQPENVEEFLSNCEHLKDLPRRTEKQTDKIGLTATQYTDLIEFLKDAKEKIRKRCDFLSNSDTDKKAILSLESHKKFLRCFARRSGRKPRLQLFTTNYDLCFEKAASETGFVVADGFSFSFPRRFSSLNFGLEIAQRRGQNGESLEPIDNVFRLFKLHGSVNWDHRDEGVIQQDTPINPCLIQPASTKFQQAFEQPYLEMMSHYLEAMRQPDQTLIVVGFGFADAHLTSPICSALESSNRFRLVVVDPTLKARTHAREGFFETLSKWMAESDERLTLVNGTFSQFMDLVPRIHKPSDAELLADAVQRIARKSTGEAAP